MSAAEQIRKAQAAAKRESLEALFAQQVRAAKLPTPVRNYRFHMERRWAADFGFLEYRLLVEIEGGTRSGGRHVRGTGYENDCEKYNAATEDGWTVLRYTGRMVRTGHAIRQVTRVLMKRRAAQQIPPSGAIR